MKRLILLFTCLALSPLALTGCGGDNKIAATTIEPDDSANFQTGDLSFSDISMDSSAHSGFDTTISFDVTAETAKYNVYVKLELENLQQGSVEDLDISAEDYQPDHELTAFVIDQMEAGETRHIQGNRIKYGTITEVGIFHPSQQFVS